MDGALRAKGSIDAALGPLELARGPRDEARMCAVVASPLEGGRDNSSDCSSVVACEPIDPDPRPSPLCEFKDCRRLRFDLVEPAVGGRSRGTAWTNCREVGTGDGRELGPSFANPSATGLSMSPRFGLASRLRKERIGDVVTFRPTGLEILLSGSGMAAASAVARGGGIESIRLCAANRGFSTPVSDDFLLCDVAFFFFHGSGMVIVMFSLSAATYSSSDSSCPSPLRRMKTPSSSSWTCGGVGGRS